VISTPSLLDGEASVLAVLTAGRQFLGRESEIVLALVRLGCSADVKMRAWV